MIPAISQVCTLHAGFLRDLEDYAAGKCPAVEFWFTKLEQFLADHSVDQLRTKLTELELQVAAASFQGGLFVAENARREEAWKLFSQRITLCQQVGIPTLVVAVDIVEPLSQTLIERVPRTLQQMAEVAGPREVRIALEFQRQNTFVNNLQTAAALVGECGSPHVGICLDLFHFGVGCSQVTDLGYLTKDNLFHVQLSDVADVARELAVDGDRILPGEGDLPVTAVIEHLTAIGYDKYVAVEVMNPQLWQVPPREFAEIATTALRRVLGQASHQ